MNYKIITLIFCVALVGCAEVQNVDTTKEDKAMKSTDSQRTSVLGKESIIYTTASETKLRLTETGKVTFKAALQPLENEISVFVNPNKSFQSLLGLEGQ